MLCNVTLSLGLQKFIYFDDYPNDLTIKEIMISTVIDYDRGLFFEFICFYIQTFLFLMLTLLLNYNLYRWLTKFFRFRALIKFKGQKNNHSNKKPKVTPILEAKCIYKLHEQDTYKNINTKKFSIKWVYNYFKFGQERINFTKSAKYELGSRLRYDVDMSVSGSSIDANAAVKFHNVWKKFGKTYVVRSFTLNVYSGEIVVLLGHNSSGKSTIMKMICGLMLPSFGEIYISGLNIYRNSRQAFLNTGVSLPFHKFYSELSVFDHLVFCCRLRGLKKSEAKEDVRAYICYLQMENIEKASINQLTPGQKCVLQSLCAFTGRTKIVLLDKPFDGMDEAKKSLFISFVQEQKRNRTIFISTNFPNTASCLADRIAILSRGKLIYIGNEKKFFKKFKDAYRLVRFINKFLFNYILFLLYILYAFKVTSKSLKYVY